MNDDAVWMAVIVGVEIGAAIDDHQAKTGRRRPFSDYHELATRASELFVQWLAGRSVEEAMPYEVAESIAGLLMDGCADSEVLDEFGQLHGRGEIVLVEDEQ